MPSKVVLFNITNPEIAQLNDHDVPTVRCSRYNLGSEFLNLRKIGLTMLLKNGAQPVKSLEMVERHYFRGRVLHQFSSKFGHVNPNCTIDWEVVYNMPSLSREEKQEIIDAPWEVKSDTFFFAEGKLIIHNRMEYNYAS